METVRLLPFGSGRSGQGDASDGSSSEGELRCAEVTQERVQGVQGQGTWLVGHAVGQDGQRSCDPSPSASKGA